MINVRKKNLYVRIVGSWVIMMAMALVLSPARTTAQPSSMEDWLLPVVPDAPTRGLEARYFLVDSAKLDAALPLGARPELVDMPTMEGGAITLDLRAMRSPIDASTAFWQAMPFGETPSSETPSSETPSSETPSSGTPNGSPENGSRSNAAAPVSFSNFRCFRGVVHGEPHSRVVLCAFGGSVLCAIVRESGERWIVGPAKNSSQRGLHLLVRENDLLAAGGFTPFNCMAEDIPQPNALVPVQLLLAQVRDRAAHRPGSNPPGSNPLGSNRSGSNDLGSNGITSGATDRAASGDSPFSTTYSAFPSTLLQADVAVEADSCFYHDAGGTTPLVLGYIASLVAMASVIYEDEANITLHLTWVKVWPSGDPYNVKGNAYALPDTVRAYWKLHYQDVPRDVAHVLTSIGYGGGGYGWFSLCGTDYSYSVSSPQTGHDYPTFAFTYDAYIVAHELGHNFSLPHSHTCYWDPPLDTCYTRNDPVHGLTLGDACDTLPITPRPSPGTIMSYCAGANYTLSGNDITHFKLEMTFSPKVDSVLRFNAEQAACIQPPPDSMLLLLAPRGSETYRGDSTVDIHWTFAHVDSVSLEYSPDGGSFWTSIARGLPAANGHFAWKTPNILSEKMLLRVLDAADNTIADTSLLFFAVTPHAAVASGPKGKAGGLTLRALSSGGDVRLVPSAYCPHVRLEIVSMLGAVLREYDGPLAYPAGTLLSMGDLSSGAYIVRMSAPAPQTVDFIYRK